jgi:hypothetical protein
LTRKPQERPSRTPKLDGQRLQELSHQSPRNFGKKRSTWTLQLLADACSELGIADGKSRLIVIWEDASWHSGRPVSDWIAAHNREMKRCGGVKIVLCPLPAKSPWLNNIETRWGPAKRAILEPDRLLTGQEVVTRVCEHFDCEMLLYLKSKTTQQEGARLGS